MRILTWIVLIAWLLTLLRTVLNLLLVPRLRPRGDADGPLVSVIIPARNEEASIEGTVRALLAQTHRSLEVIVVDDRSTDATGTILERMAGDDARLRVISGTDTPPGWLGKPWALQQGSSAAAGELLLFVDADIHYQPAAVAAAVALLQESGAGMLSLFPRIVMASFWEWVVMPQLTLFVFSLLPTWLSNRTTIALLGIGGGTGNLIRRADYAAVGGHEVLRNAVVDDVALARLVRRNGHRTIAARADDLVSVRMYEGGRAILEGFTKNTFAVFSRSYFRLFVISVIAFALHVLPYGLALAGDLLSVAAVVLITGTRLILFTAMRYRLDYALWAHPLMVLFWLWIAVRSMWITGVRRELAWRGRSYDARGTRFGA